MRHRSTRSKLGQGLRSESNKYERQWSGSTESTFRSYSTRYEGVCYAAVSREKVAGLPCWSDSLANYGENERKVVDYGLGTSCRVWI